MAIITWLNLTRVIGSLVTHVLEKQTFDVFSMHSTLDERVIAFVEYVNEAGKQLTTTQFDELWTALHAFCASVTEDGFYTPAGGQKLKLKYPVSALVEHVNTLRPEPEPERCEVCTGVPEDGHETDTENIVGSSISDDNNGHDSDCGNDEDAIINGLTNKNENVDTPSVQHDQQHEIGPSRATVIEQESQQEVVAKNAHKVDRMPEEAAYESDSTQEEPPRPWVVQNIWRKLCGLFHIGLPRVHC